MWFRVGLAAPVGDDFGVNLVLDLDGDPANGEPWWLRAAESFTAVTPWARDQGLEPAEALIAYLRRRLQVEAALRDRLSIAWLDLPSPAGGTGDWTSVDEPLRAIAERVSA